MTSTEMEKIKRFVSENWDEKTLMFYFFAGLYVEKSGVEFKGIVLAVHDATTESWARNKIKMAYRRVTGVELT